MPGQTATLAFVDTPTAAPVGVAVISTGRVSQTLPFLAGTLIADPASGVTVPMGASASVGSLPLSLHGRTLFIQGALSEGPRFVLTDATQVNFARPLAVIGTQASLNGLTVLDVATGTVSSRFGNGEVDTIALASDRRRAYVAGYTVIGVYDVSVTPAVLVANITTTNPIRQHAVFAPDERRLYVPVQDGVDVVDTDPRSPTYHSLLFKIPTPIVGSATSPGLGPRALAVNPDGTKLLIAYGESGVSFPGGSTALGVVDPRTPGNPVRRIALSVSGVASSNAVHDAVQVSPDGQFAYVAEVAYVPGASGTVGFANGGALKVVDVVNEVEVTAIPTGGVVPHITIDFLGRNLWVAQRSVTPQLLTHWGELLRIDIDRRGATRHTISNRIRLDAQPYSSMLGAGPRGVTTTADGSTVLVTLSQDPLHPVAVALPISSASNALGAPIPISDWPGQIRCQR